MAKGIGLRETAAFLPYALCSMLYAFDFQHLKTEERQCKRA
jgi:hypothetical protein